MFGLFPKNKQTNAETLSAIITKSKYDELDGYVDRILESLNSAASTENTIVDVKNLEGDPLLIIAVRKSLFSIKGDNTKWEQVATLLLNKYNADVSITDKAGRTALSYAIFADPNNKFVQPLITKGINVRNNDEKTALSWGFDNFKNPHNRDPTSMLTNILNSADVDVNLTDNEGKTALMYASRYVSNSKLLDLLLEKNPDLNVKDKEGKTALMYACVNGNTVLVNLLLEHSADVNVIDNQGKTALMYACANGNTVLVNLLLEHSADVNVTDKKGKTALSYLFDYDFIPEQNQEELTLQTIQLLVTKTRRDLIYPAKTIVDSKRSNNTTSVKTYDEKKQSIPEIYQVDAQPKPVNTTVPRKDYYDKILKILDKRLVDFHTEAKGGKRKMQSSRKLKPKSSRRCNRYNKRCCGNKRKIVTQKKGHSLKV
jgi:ankyrin repeat protein